jgi:hypothetical protein
MPVMGIDFAWTKPTAAEAKAAGAHWAAGYYSEDPSKNLTHALVAEYIAAGLAIVGVWETTTTRALAGYAAGQADARTASEQRAAVGLPATAVIHFAVDTDTDWASVEQYFAGAANVLGQGHVGVYGGLHVIAGAAAAGYKYLWQTVAWSGGVWDSHATIHQEANTLFGGNADVDYSETADFGQYPNSNSSGGTDLPTPLDVWAYKGPGDSPDVHQTVQNIANDAKASAAALAALKTEVDAIKVAVGAVAAPKLTDAQVAAIAAQLTPVLVPAILQAMGHALDAAK